MQGRTVLIRAFFFTTLAVMVLATASPARAAATDYKGWFVALDVASTTPTGLDQRYAVTVDEANTGNQEYLFFDNKAHISGSVRVGYSFGELGGLEATYWTFDHDDSLSKTEGTLQVYPTVFGGYAYNNGGTYGINPASTYKVDSSIKAHTADVDYFRVQDAGEKFSIKWIAGLRSAHYEEDLSFEGTGATNYTAATGGLNQTKHMDTNAFGVKAGAKVSYGISKHFGLQGTLAFSVLEGKTDQETTQDANGIADQLKVSTDHIQGEIRDYDVRAVWSWPRFDVYVGYGGQTWEGLVKDRTGDESPFDASKINGDDRNSIGFMSYHAGIVWRFGKQ